MKGKSRCFGFVTYKDPQLLDEVLSKKHSLDGKEVVWMMNKS